MGSLTKVRGDCCCFSFWGDDKDYITMNKIIMLYYQLTTMSWQQPSTDNPKSVPLAPLARRNANGVFRRDS